MNGMCVKNNIHICVAGTSNNRVIVACKLWQYYSNMWTSERHDHCTWRVIAACDLYCCLLPQCEALRTCRSGFPIATAEVWVLSELLFSTDLSHFLCESCASLKCNCPVCTASLSLLYCMLSCCMRLCHHCCLLYPQPILTNFFNSTVKQVLQMFEQIIIQFFSDGINSRRWLRIFVEESTSFFFNQTRYKLIFIL